MKRNSIKRVISSIALFAAVGMSAYAAKPMMYGYRAWSGSAEHDDLGWYKIAADGKTALMWIDNTDVLPAYFISGWVRDGKLCGIYGNRSTSYYINYDVATGDFAGLYEIYIEGTDVYKYMMTAAYNPDDDYVYGFSFNEDYSEDYFVRAPATDLNAVEVIRRMPDDYTMCMSLCFNETDHHIYGIDFLGDLIRIDTRGNFELAATYGLSDDPANLANWASGMCYSALDDSFYWNRQLGSFESSWIRIDATSYEYENVRELPIFDLYTVLTCPDTDGDEHGPVQPVLAEDGVTTTTDGCKMVFIMPGKLADGSDISTPMTWTAIDRVSGKSLSGTAATGEKVTVEFGGLSAGEHTFQFFANSGTDKGVSKYVNRWIGKDVPARVSDIRLERGEDSFHLSWAPLTEGTHGGMVNTDDVVYHVFVDGVKVAQTKETSVDISGPEDKNLIEFDAMLIATCEGEQSDPAYSNKILTETPRELPYLMVPDADQMRLVTFVNTDNDKSEWKVAKDFLGKEVFFCTADQKNQSDDWLIMPAITFDDPAYMYEVEFEVCANSNVKTGEFIEVKLGDKATAQAMTLATPVKATNVRGTTYTTVSGRFGIPEAGIYYLSLHSISQPKMSGMYVHNIRISKTEEVNAVSEIVGGAVRVSGGVGEIELRGLAGNDVRVYSADGILRAEITVLTDIESISVPSGIYVVNAGNANYKTIVK